MNKENKSFQLTSEDTNSTTIVSTLIFFIIVATGVWYFYGGGLEKEANSNLQELKDSVAEDSIAQYNIAKLSNDPIEICVQAGMVSTSFLQAQNQNQYLVWKEIEKNDCERAGL